MTRDEIAVRTREVTWRGVAVGGTDAPTVLHLHGFPEDHRTWGEQLDPLAAAGYRPVAVDLPGMGRSDTPSSYRIGHVSSLLADLAGALDASGVHLVGHDWGAILAAAAGASAPASFRSVTLSGGPHPDAFRAAFRWPRQLARSWYVAAFQLPGAAVAVGTLGGGRALFRTRTPIRTWRDARRALAYYRKNMGPTTLPRHRVGRIAVPAVVIHGMRDRYVGVELMRESARRCADLRGFHVLDAGHYAHRERRDEWRRLLLRFLASVERTEQRGPER